MPFSDSFFYVFEGDDAGLLAPGELVLLLQEDRKGEFFWSEEVRAITRCLPKKTPGDILSFD